MAEQLDPRLEARLRAAFHAEADALPFTITTAEVRRRSAARAQARSRQRFTLLASAAAVGVAVGGLLLFAGLRYGTTVGQSPSPDPAPSSVPSPTASPSASATPSPAASAEPSGPELPSLPANVAGGEVIAQVSSAEPGPAAMTNPIPDGMIKFTVVAACRGTGTLEIDLDGVAAILPCEPLTIETFVPPLGPTSTIKVSPQNVDAYVLEVRATTEPAPGVTFVPPVATLTGPGGGVPGYAGCGLSFRRPNGENATDDCGPSWMPIPDDRAIRASAGGSLVLSLPADWTITGVQVQATDHATIQSSGRGPAATDLFTGTPGSSSVTLPVPGAGDWGLRVDVAATNADGTEFSVPYYARVIVTP